MSHTILAVHGIFDNGNWHKELARSVWPHFGCESIRYREYHAFGFVNIFFWPWAILFAGVLGWFAAQQSALTARDVWIAVAVTLGCGIVAAFRSGIGRTVPWFWVSAFWLGSSGNWKTLLPLVVAGLVISGIGWLFTKADRRSVLFWLAGIVVTVASWGGGWLFALAGQSVLLAGASALLGLYLAYCEYHWRGWTFLVFVPAIFGVGGAIISLVSPTTALFGVVPLALLMLFLEFEECRGGCCHESKWLAAVAVIAVAVSAAWIYTPSYPWAAFATAGFLLVVGFFEPSYRMQRAVAKVVEQVDRFVSAKPLSRRSLMAHSLGAFTSAKAFDQRNVQLERVLFLGGAVAESYKWEPFISEPDPMIEDVRNELGTMDFVIKMLSMAGSWATRQGLGGAGCVGFQPTPPTVAHEVLNARNGCTHCPTDPPVRLHNYRLSDYRHSTFLVRRDHLVDYWLPYFWGHPPHDVRGFHRSCVTLHEALNEAPRNPYKINTLLRKYRKRRRDWYGFGRVTFSGVVREVVGPRMEQLDLQYPTLPVRPSREVLYRAAAIVAKLVTEAICERGKPSPDEEKLRYLNPPIAIAEAARMACEEVTNDLQHGRWP
jgi:hypothetical protein